MEGMHIPRRRDGRALKAQLPYPYNQDFSGVLRDLNRITLRGRGNLANDPVTAAFVAAADRLIQRHLGPRPAHPDAEDLEPGGRLLQGFLSQRQVVAEMCQGPHPFPREGNLASLRDRWKRHSHFIADVTRFCLWEAHYPGAHQDEIAGVTDDIISGPDPVRAIRRLGYWDVKRLLSTPMFRFGLMAGAQAECDKAIREAIAGHHRDNGREWRRYCDEFLDARGLRVRPGISPDDCVTLLTALADGLTLRALADPGPGTGTARIIDHEKRFSLLGTGALALIAGCVEPSGSADGLTLEQAAARIIHGGEERAGSR
jgi:hypothetical protein